MAEPKKDLVSVWNIIIPNFKISHKDLQNPQPLFFIDALSSLLESIDIKLENVIFHSEENHLLPLLQLSAAVNLILMEISPNVKTITLYDLIKPEPFKVSMVLQVLLNYAMFVEQRKEQIIEREKEIDDILDQTEKMKSGLDMLNIKIDDNLLKKESIKTKLTRMESEISNLKVRNDEPEKRVNGLKTELDIIEEKRERLKSELIIKQTLLASQLEEIMKLEACVLTENEQEEVLNAKESAVQHNKEIDDKLKEIKSTLWKKEEDINTFRADKQHLTKCEEMLNDLKDIYNKIKITHGSNETAYGKEKELSESKDKISTLENDISQIQSTNDQLQEELEKLKATFDIEEKQYNAQLNGNKNEADDYNEKIKVMTEEIQSIKLTTKKYNVESQSLRAKLKDIPSVYDEYIEDHTNRIMKIINKVKKAEADYLDRMNKL
ncbi:uncharacterized protein LOC143916652 [Arctopsyche grandis]|uniref:uncharacterized protein LOC143916652 n=1 Tax=Arctopsyche grandis TaxID=121162 RepID=UPI00406D67D8